MEDILDTITRKPIKLRKPYKNDESDFEVVSIAVMQGNVDALNEQQRHVLEVTKEAYNIVSDHPIKSQAVKALGALHPDISQAQLYRYIDYAIRIWNPKNRLDREFLETVFVNKLMQEICREEATEESRSKNLATMQKYLASLPPESIDPSMLQKHDIYIQLNINGSNIDIPFEKLRLLTDETKRIAGALDQEITDVQAAEIMEG